jgi:hypothetical protein
MFRWTWWATIPGSMHTWFLGYRANIFDARPGVRAKNFDAPPAMKVMYTMFRCTPHAIQGIPLEPMHLVCF